MVGSLNGWFDEGMVGNMMRWGKVEWMDRRMNKGKERCLARKGRIVEPIDGQSVEWAYESKFSSVGKSFEFINRRKVIFKEVRSRIQRKKVLNSLKANNPEN